MTTTSTTAKDVTDTQRLTVLKHLASGKTPDIVATITRLDRSTVVDIGSHHGYPDTTKLAWAVDILEKKITEAQAPPVTTRPRPATAPSTSSSTQPPRPAPAAEQPLTRPDEIRVLLNTAKAHPSKRIQRAADKVFADLDRLRDLIREDQEKNAERRAEEAKKAAARAEIKRLEEQLAAAKAKLRGTGTASTIDVGSDVSAAALRAWAKRNGIACPATGRVPKSVREAYAAAEGEERQAS